MSPKHFGVTHEALKKQIAEAGQRLGNSAQHQQVMGYPHRRPVVTLHNIHYANFEFVETGPRVIHISASQVCSARRELLSRRPYKSASLHDYHLQLHVLLSTL
jgi:hypothetical protein